MTEGQASCGDRRLHLPRGKVLGGSSSLNGMIYIRGWRGDYDYWAYLGNAGWGYEDVLPLFKRSEDFDGGESEYHGVGGPLRVVSRYEPHPVNAACTATCSGGARADSSRPTSSLSASTCRSTPRSG
jgi:choline dehydrogenase